MLYAILAYHVEADVMSWTPAQDAALMTNLNEVHDLPHATCGASIPARSMKSVRSRSIVRARSSR